MESNIKIRLIKLKEVSSFIHLKDMKSIENWCKSNRLDIYISGRRKYVYEHELIKVLEFNYVNDTMKKHPQDFIERVSNCVSYSTLLKFTGCTITNAIVSVNPYGFLPSEIQDLLKTI